MASFLEKVLRTGDKKVLTRLRSYTTAINSLEDGFRELSDAELRAETDAFRARVADGESLDRLLPEAFAVVREAASRTLGQRHYDVQLMGGAALHLGNIAEMKTGEGKTLVATFPAYLNALTGKPVHVVTVNDYLAKRDAEWMSKVYGHLGLTTGVVYPFQPDDEKRAAYRADLLNLAEEGLAQTRAAHTGPGHGVQEQLLVLADVREIALNLLYPALLTHLHLWPEFEVRLPHAWRAAAGLRFPKAIYRLEQLYAFGGQEEARRALVAEE